MTPDQTKLLNLLTSRGLAEQAQQAVAGDATAMAAVLDDLNTPSVTRHNTEPVGMAATLAALGADAGAVIVAFESSPVGRAGLSKLGANGLDYGHPLTTTLLNQMTAAGAITQEQNDVLKSLSVSVLSPAEDVGLPEVTAEHVQTAMATPAEPTSYASEIMLAANLSADGTLRLNVRRVTIGLDADGNQVNRVSSLPVISDADTATIKAIMERCTNGDS